MNFTFRPSRMQRLRKELPLAEVQLHRRLSLAAVAGLVLDQARRRTQYLPDAIFEDPQWLMILDLFVAAEESREVSVSSLCGASGVPATTALRHIRYLQAQGIIERVSHPNDRRISLVRLGQASRRQVARYLTSIAPALVSGGNHSESGANY